MKKIFTLLTVLFTFSLVGFAQDIDVPSLVVDLAEDGSIEYDEFLITNNTGGEIVLACTMSPVINCGDQEISVCIGQQCYGFTTEPANYNNAGFLETMQDGDVTGQFAIHHINGDGHEASWQICFYDLNNPNTETCITINIDGDACTTNVSELDSSTEIKIGNIFPNPTINELNFDYLNSSAEASFQVFDLTGKTILSGSILSGDGTHSINTSALESGVYFISIEQSGKISRTQRFFIER